MELLQTACALSGLSCLMMILLSVKRMLKKACRC